MIPKTVHQTAPSVHLTSEEVRVLNRNKKMMPGWEFILHDDRDNERLFHEVLPKYSGVYQSIKRGVVRADIIRCVYMLRFGGWYLDTDYRLLRPLDSRFEGDGASERSGLSGEGQNRIDLLDHKLILPISGIAGKDRHLVCNSVLASEAGHPFWMGFLEHIFSNKGLKDLAEGIVEETTGPLGLSRYYLDNKKAYPDIYLPAKEYFHPQIIRCGFSYSKHPETYGVHWCWGSWRSKNMIRRWKNRLTRKITSYL